MQTQTEVQKRTEQQMHGRIGHNVKLYELAKRCLREADGDLRAAADRLVAVMDSKPAIYRAALDKFKEQAAYDAVRVVMRAERQHIQYQPSDASKAADAALVQAVERHWYEYPLSSGLRLGDASNADLLAQAKIHEAQERGNAWKRRFMQSIADRVPEGTKVRALVTEEDLAKLYREAESC